MVKNAVANDISMMPDGNVIFLTGANMAGKSTLMKSIKYCNVPGSYGISGTCRTNGIPGV